MSACPTLSELIGAPGVFDIPDEVRDEVLDGFLARGDMGRLYRTKPRHRREPCDSLVGRIVRPSMLMEYRPSEDLRNLGVPMVTRGDKKLELRTGAEAFLEKLKGCLNTRSTTGKPLVSVGFFNLHDYFVAWLYRDVFKETRSIVCGYVITSWSTYQNFLTLQASVFENMTKVESVTFQNRGDSAPYRSERVVLGEQLGLLANVKTVRLDRFNYLWNSEMYGYLVDNLKQLKHLEKLVIDGVEVDIERAYRVLGEDYDPFDAIIDLLKKLGITEEAQKSYYAM